MQQREPHSASRRLHTHRQPPTSGSGGRKSIPAGAERAGRQRLHPGTAGAWLGEESRDPQVAFQKRGPALAFLRRVLLWHPATLKSHPVPEAVPGTMPHNSPKSIPNLLCARPESTWPHASLTHPPYLPPSVGTHLPQSGHRAASKSSLDVGREEGKE